MYWRRFAVSSIPLDDADDFSRWLQSRWVEKDDLMEIYRQTGRFPTDEAAKTASLTGDGYIETTVRITHWWEFGQMFVVLLALALVLHWVALAWAMLHGSLAGR